MVEKILNQLQLNVDQVLTDSNALDTINLDSLLDNEVSEFSLKEIITELKKPSRDPRPAFKTANFAEGVTSVADLVEGMILEGVVSNVANFGAFVDIGVHQDGLVHISSITDKFVSDPREIVKAGDVVKVKVLEVDPARKRISLTMRLAQEVNEPAVNNDNVRRAQKTIQPKKPSSEHKKSMTHSPKRASKKIDNAAMGNAFADAFAKLKK